MNSSVPFHSKGVRVDSLHTASLLAPHLRPGDSVLDIGCSQAYVAAVLLEQGYDTWGADIVDSRRVPLPNFVLYDGLVLDFPDRRFDVVMLNFVLHHVPNDKKAALVASAMRVAKRLLFVLEDTPRNRLDWYFSHRHGEQHRRSIDSAADYGFYDEAGWVRFFAEQELAITEQRRLGRFSRDWKQPYARTMFVLARPA